MSIQLLAYQPSLKNFRFFLFRLCCHQSPMRSQIYKKSLIALSDFIYCPRAAEFRPDLFSGKYFKNQNFTGSNMNEDAITHQRLAAFKLLANAGTRISSLLSEYLIGNFDIGINEWRVILFAEKSEGQTIGDVCKHAKIYKSVVSRAIQHLEAKGLLAVTRTNRNVRIALSPEGRIFLAHVKPIAQEKEEELMGEISADDAKLLEQTLQRIASNLDKFDN
ncbi:MarR family winged helix-turn-helix transcriptional regulator [Pseudomonas aeruginosa]|uniref:MarR family winged helix-turn-helix transcriptional regulator n=2 Tax=Pseudomonas aeruginosa TaxID=287 RepID=UPI00117B9709|nr:MarR family transcriptional regulator [Pseudomonas aeruginosa]